jgi:ammonium transporter, Amt family
VVPYPSWLNAGDTSWQLTAATLVGLMSLPGLAVLYGGLVQRKWAVNTMIMAFSGFCLVLIVWVLWVFKMGFGQAWIGTFVGHPGPVLGSLNEQGQANVPNVSGAGLMPHFRFPQSALVYFQFVFAAITPLLFLGSVIGRISFKVWLIFVPLWSTFAYAVNAFLLWGGGWWAAHGALDFSGGYVIHLAAGVSGFVAAAVIGPRLKRDRSHGVPNNLLLVSVGAGILWLGWNGFNGGDPYFAGSDAAAAVLNTNLAAAVAMITWIVMDMLLTKEKKATFLGGINGMIVGLVGITPAAGYVNGLGAMAIGLFGSAIVCLAGGLMVGLFADPHMIVYLGLGKNPDVTTAGLFYGHPKQLLIQAGAALTVIVWDALITFLILRGLGLFMKLRLPDEVLETGDVAIHNEEVYPSEALTRVASGAAAPPSAAPAAAKPAKVPSDNS